MQPMGVAWLLLLPNMGIWWLGFVGGMGNDDDENEYYDRVSWFFDLAKERF
jgi:hypothetical protein